MPLIIRESVLSQLKKVMRVRAVSDSKRNYEGSLHRFVWDKKSLSFQTKDGTAELSFVVPVEDDEQTPDFDVWVDGAVCGRLLGYLPAKNYRLDVDGKLVIRDWNRLRVTLATNSPPGNPQDESNTWTSVRKANISSGQWAAAIRWVVEQPQNEQADIHGRSIQFDERGAWSGSGVSLRRAQFECPLKCALTVSEAGVLLRWLDAVGLGTVLAEELENNGKRRLTVRSLDGTGVLSLSSLPDTKLDPVPALTWAVECQADAEGLRAAARLAMAGVLGGKTSVRLSTVAAESGQGVGDLILKVDDDPMALRDHVPAVLKRIENATATVITARSIESALRLVEAAQVELAWNEGLFRLEADCVIEAPAEKGQQRAAEDAQQDTQPLQMTIKQVALLAARQRRPGKRLPRMNQAEIDMTSDEDVDASQVGHSPVVT